MRETCTWLAVLAVAASGCNSGPASVSTANNTPAAYYANQQMGGPAAGQENSTWSSLARSVSQNPLTAGMTANNAPATPSAAMQSAVDPLSLGNEKRELTPNLYVSMGQIAEQQGRIDEARKHYQKAISANPTDTGALLAYARLEDRQGDLTEALKLYEAAAATTPDHAGAYNDLGLCLARTGQLHKSVGMLQRAVQLQPAKPLYRNNLATVLVELDRPDEALTQLKAVYPPAQAHYNVGFWLQKRGLKDAAADQFATAVSYDPTFASALQWLAKLRPEYAPQTQVASNPGPAEVPSQGQPLNQSVTVPYVGTSQPGPAPGNPYQPVSTTRSTAVQPMATGGYVLPAMPSTTAPPIESQFNSATQGPIAPSPALPPTMQGTPSGGPTMPYPTTGSAPVFPGVYGPGAAKFPPLQMPTDTPNTSLQQTVKSPPSPVALTNAYALPASHGSGVVNASAVR